MHLKRWITGLAALPILVFLVYQGGILFLALLCAVSVGAMLEYVRIISSRNPAAAQPRMTWLGLIAGPGMLIAAHWGHFDLCLGLLALNLIGVGLISLFEYQTHPQVLDAVRFQLQGMVYIPLLLLFLLMIRNQPDGMRWVFFILGIVFAGDTGAYYVGSYLGRRKLCPAVSPGKTVEGAIGGLAANTLVGAAAKWLFMPALPWAASLLFFVSIGAVGQLGDLFESELKRSSNIKDSGGILPGHGGLLDRIDALLFAAPVAYLFIRYIF